MDVVAVAGGTVQKQYCTPRTASVFMTQSFRLLFGPGAGRRGVAVASLPRIRCRPSLQPQHYKDYIHAHSLKTFVHTLFRTPCIHICTHAACPLPSVALA